MLYLLLQGTKVSRFFYNSHLAVLCRFPLSPPHLSPIFSPHSYLFFPLHFFVSSSASQYTHFRFLLTSHLSALAFRLSYLYYPFFINARLSPLLRRLHLSSSLSPFPSPSLPPLSLSLSFLRKKTCLYRPVRIYSFKWLDGG